MVSYGGLMGFNKIFYEIHDDLMGFNGIFHGIYPPVNVYIANWKIKIFLLGKSTINGPFSIAMLNYRRRIF